MIKKQPRANNRTPAVSRASNRLQHRREPARQQAPTTKESGPIKSGDRVQWEQRIAPETAFVSGSRRHYVVCEDGTKPVPVKRLRKADVSPLMLCVKSKANGGLVPMGATQTRVGEPMRMRNLGSRQNGGEIALHRLNQPRR